MSGPTSHLPSGDQGAEAIRNFKLQFAYGVVLLTASALTKQDYRAIWCEQEDDLLGEIDDNTFDSYQVKSQKPEDGPWTIKKSGFVAAVKVFRYLEATYPGRIRFFNFVSNTQLLDSDDKKKEFLCPGRLATAVQGQATGVALSAAAAKGLKELAMRAECAESELVPVLTRLRFATTPSRDAFIAELESNHVSALPGCDSAPLPRLKKAVRESMGLVYAASSLSSQDPSRHYACLKAGSASDPQLKAKRIELGEFLKVVQDCVQQGFRYLPPPAGSPNNSLDPSLRRFLKKLARGDLEFYVDTLRSQALAAEAALLELVTRGPDGPRQVEHLRKLVKDECDFAHLQASKHAEPFGKDMLRDVEVRLNTLATSRPADCCHQPRPMLLGIAGILTENCEVWWSARFEVDEDK